MNTKLEASKSRKKPGWRKGCGVTALILALVTLTLAALVLNPDHNATVEAILSGGAIRGSGDDQDTNASGSEPAPKPSATNTATPTPTPPLPTATWTPTATPPPVPSGEQTEPEAQPDPEPSEEFVAFEMEVLGLLFKSREYYSTGTVAAGLNDGNPYAFVKSSMPSMDIRLRTMPTEQLPGDTPLQALPVLFQERLVEKLPSGEWNIVTDPFDLEVNGLPASRMAAELERGERTYCYHATAIRGETRSSFVYGSYGVPCAEAQGRAEEITAIADSVQLRDPGPVCSVGLKPGSDPADYGVGCDYALLGWMGEDALKDAGYTDIVLGPATWDECAVFMREHDQPWW
jgi:hypothetical protein